MDFLKALFKVRRPTFNLLLIALFFTPAVASFYLGIQPHVVSTGSMKPNINPGDVILTKLSKAVEIRRGDVILLFDNGSQRSEAHRVLEVAYKDGDSQITTKGDSNPLPDPMLSEPGNKPLQKVVLVIGNAGYVLELTHSSEAKMVGGGVILSFSCESAEEVRAITEKAFSMGARRINDPEDSDFMLSWAFEDLDGHLWDLFWIKE